MGKQEILLTASKAQSRQRARQEGRFGPAMEGKTWDKCKVCGRPVYDKISRARRMGSTCYKRQQEAKNLTNTLRNQQDLQKQLTLFGATPLTKFPDEPKFETPAH